MVLQFSCQGQLILTCIFAVTTLLGGFAPCSPSLSGKYEVSIMVPLFFSVTVNGGWCSQGCHGYLTCLALVLKAPHFSIFPVTVPKLVYC